MKRVIHILVADDSATNRKLIAGALSHRNFEFSFVGNGQEAIHAMRQKSFDLVFLNCQMPVMDGFSASRKIRKLEEHEAVRRTAIVGTSVNLDLRDQSLAAGMDDFIGDPSFSIDQFLQIIDQWVPLPPGSLT